MDDVKTDNRFDKNATTHDDQCTPWERALAGPPINPRSELIYHDGKQLRGRHRS